MERSEILIRIPPELARLIRIRAAEAEISRNEWINRILLQAAKKNVISQPMGNHKP